MRTIVLAASFTLALGSLALIGCASEPEPSLESASASQTATCLSHAEAKANFERAVAEAQARVQTADAAAKRAHEAGVAEAKREFDAAVAHVTNSPDMSAVLAAAAARYNHEVGPDGPLARAYNEAVAAARVTYDADCRKATDVFNATICH